MLNRRAASPFEVRILRLFGASARHFKLRTYGIAEGVGKEESRGFVGKADVVRSPRGRPGKSLGEFLVRHSSQKQRHTILGDSGNVANLGCKNVGR